MAEIVESDGGVGSPRLQAAVPASWT